MSRARPATFHAAHTALGHHTERPPSLFRYHQRHGIGHLITAGRLDSARDLLTAAEGLLGLHAHPDIWPTVHAIGTALWPEGMAAPLSEAAQAQIAHAHPQSAAMADVVLPILRSLGAWSEGLVLVRSAHRELCALPVGPAIQRARLILVCSALGGSLAPVRPGGRPDLNLHLSVRQV